MTDTNESIDVPPNADNGNVPVDTPIASSEVPKEPAAAAEPAAPATPAEVEPELFELPDGRKVDAATVAQEYKSLLSDYTKKAQLLAEKEKEEGNINNKATNPLADPEFVPQSYAELAEHIKAQTLAELEAKEKARIEAHQALENEVSVQLEEVKKIDPNINENALFLHATKYGFRDLRLAHQNMTDMTKLVKDVKQTTAKDIAKRTDPVSASPGATGTRPDPSQFETAIEYLRSLQS